MIESPFTNIYQTEYDPFEFKWSNIWNCIHVVSFSLSFWSSSEFSKIVFSLWCIWFIRYLIWTCRNRFPFAYSGFTNHKCHYNNGRKKIQLKMESPRQFTMKIEGINDHNKPPWVASISFIIILIHTIGQRVDEDGFRVSSSVSGGTIALIISFIVFSAMTIAIEAASIFIDS